MLAEAIEAGDRLQALFVWDGEGGDGPGGTEHLATAVVAAGGGLTIIHP
jgi:hypothetical protein